MLAGANCLLLVNSKCIYCHQKVTEGNLTKIFFIILSICSLIETSSTCWWCGWKRVGRWRRGRTHPWADKTWWKSEFRQGNWWMTCRRRLIPRQRSSLACTTTAERERKKKSIRHKSGSTGRCKNTGSCLFLGGAGGKNRCLVWLPFFKRCLCRTITATAAKALLSKAEKNVLGKWQFLFKDESLTLVLGLAPLEQVSRLTHYSSAL